MKTLERKIEEILNHFQEESFDFISDVNWDKICDIKFKIMKREPAINENIRNNLIEIYSNE